MAKEINIFEQDLFKDIPIPTIETVDEENSEGAALSKKQETAHLNEVLSSIGERHEQQQRYNQARTTIKRVIEALLFASSEPISFQKIREVVDPIYPMKPRVLNEIIVELEMEYRSQQRSFQIEEIAQGYVLRTRKEYAPYVEELYRNKRGEKLSQASLEVLAIIAYRQPITRPQIDAVRGVDSSGIIQNLLERQLIESSGKLEAPGRPSLYVVSKEFMMHFGLKDLKDLPKFSAITVGSARAPAVLHGPVRSQEPI